MLIYLVSCAGRAVRDVGWSQSQTVKETTCCYCWGGVSYRAVALGGACELGNVLLRVTDQKSRNLFVPSALQAAPDAEVELLAAILLLYAMQKLAAATRASKLWRKARIITVALIRKRLAVARALDADSARSESHKAYLRRLQLGVRLETMADGTLRQMRIDRATQEAEAIMRSGEVVTQVGSAEAHTLGTEIDWIHQGDASLATRAKFAERFRLRHEPGVQAVLHAFWTAAVRGSGGRAASALFSDDLLDATIGYASFHALFSRVYATLLDDYREDEMAQEIHDDFLEDSVSAAPCFSSAVAQRPRKPCRHCPSHGKMCFDSLFICARAGCRGRHDATRARQRGTMEMNSTMLGDSLFELADCWVPSIDAAAYADFLWRLYRGLVDARGEWRDARACGYDGAIAAAADMHRGDALGGALVVEASVSGRVVKVEERPARAAAAAAAAAAVPPSKGSGGGDEGKGDRGADPRADRSGGSSGAQKRRSSRGGEAAPHPLAVASSVRSPSPSPSSPTAHRRSRGLAARQRRGAAVRIQAVARGRASKHKAGHRQRAAETLQGGLRTQLARRRRRKQREQTQVECSRPAGEEAAPPSNPSRLRPWQSLPTHTSPLPVPGSAAAGAAAGPFGAVARSGGSASSYSRPTSQGMSRLERNLSPVPRPATGGPQMWNDPSWPPLLSLQPLPPPDAAAAAATDDDHRHYDAKAAAATPQGARPTAATTNSAQGDGRGGGRDEGMRSGPGRSINGGGFGRGNKGEGSGGGGRHGCRSYNYADDDRVHTPLPSTSPLARSLWGHPSPLSPTAALYPPLHPPSSEARAVTPLQHALRRNVTAATVAPPHGSSPVMIGRGGDKGRVQGTAGEDERTRSGGIEPAFSYYGPRARTPPALLPRTPPQPRASPLHRVHQQSLPWTTSPNPADSYLPHGPLSDGTPTRAPPGSRSLTSLSTSRSLLQSASAPLLGPRTPASPLDPALRIQRSRSSVRLATGKRDAWSPRVYSSTFSAVDTPNAAWHYHGTFHHPKASHRRELAAPHGLVEGLSSSFEVHAALTDGKRRRRATWDFPTVKASCSGDAVVCRF